MKKFLFFKIISVTLLLLFVFSLTSCDFLEELADVDANDPNTAMVYYNTMGGNMPHGVKNSAEYELDDVISSAPIPTKEGYKFTGWTLENGTPALFPYAVKKTVTLTATWEEVIDTYAITYKLNGGALPDGSSNISIYEAGTKLASFPTPTKDGFEFLGWYLGNELVEFPYLVDNNIIVVAKWEQIEAVDPDVGKDPELDINPPLDENSALLTFDAGEGTFVDESEASSIYEIGSIVMSFPEVTREGYTFLGWAINDEIVMLPYEVTASASLVALWEREPERITVYLDVNGGSLANGVSDSFKAIVGSTLGGLPIPTSPCYTFLGWYLDGDINIPVDKTTLAPDTDINLVALWEARGEIITLEFYCEDDVTINIDSTTLEMVVGDRISDHLKALPIASREGQGLVGWFDENDNQVTLTSKIYESTTLYPKWVTLDLCTDGTENHQWTVWQEFSDATCTESARLVRTCTRCQYEDSFITQESLGHSFGEWANSLDGYTAIKSRACSRCSTTESISLNNITNRFNVPVVDGDCWGEGDGNSLVNGDYTDKPIAGKGTGSVVVTMEAYSPTYVDVFTVTGHGSSTYTVTVYYEDGTSKDIGISSFGSEKSATRMFTIGETITKIVVIMENSSIGADHWSELTAYAENN